MNKIAVKPIFAVFALALICLFACGKPAEPPIAEPQPPREETPRDEISQEATVSKEDVQQKAKEAIEAAKTYTRQQKEEYQKKIETRLTELDDGMDRLKSKALESTAEAKVLFDRDIERLEKKREVARKKLAELKDAAEQKRDDLKSELEDILAELEEKLQDLMPPME